LQAVNKPNSINLYLMRKIVICLSSFVILSLTVLISCSDTENVNPQIKLAPETAGFIESSVFKEFKKNFSNEYANIVLEETEIVTHNAEVKTINIPVKKGATIMGIVRGITIPNGKGYQLIYENYSLFSTTSKGVVELYTSKKNFIADFETEVVGTQVKFKIRNVKFNKNAALKRTGSRVSAPEWPSPNDGWWTCTSKCYDVAKDACGDAPNCDLLCDLVNLVFGQCTISITVACGIYCLTD
jgi:hypothetical protein